MTKSNSKKMLVLSFSKSTVALVVLTVSLVMGSFATAAVPAAQDEKSDAAQAPAKLKTKKSTEVNFDDVLVQGKYHFSDEAVTTVEQDKVLDALLGVRTDFKDRLSKSAARH